MATGKLARLSKQNKALKAERRELRTELASMGDEMGQKCDPRSYGRRLLELGLSAGTAYSVGRGYVAAQQKGFMPTSVPVDLLVGVVGEGALAFVPGGWSEISAEAFSGMTAGALGRIAAYQQLTRTEVAGRQALLLPAPAASGGDGSLPGRDPTEGGV